MESRIHVPVGGGYDVAVGKGIIKKCGSLLKEAGIKGKLAVISDSNVAEIYLKPVVSSLKAEGYDTVSFVFPAGEKYKTVSTFSEILEFFAKSGLTRKDCAIALGGGVTGDMTGFAAGCYMRGISYVQMPTTLLAAVDSSVGGKTAIDLEAGKNLAGLFIQPKMVICDTDTLNTLSPEILADGAAEAVKTAILGDKKLFDMLLSHGTEGGLEEIIRRCVTYKSAVVCEDETETGVRKKLNLGHTPAHGIEKLSGYGITHGHAVGMGTAIMARAAVRLGFMAKEKAKLIEAALIKNGLSVYSPFGAEELAAAAMNDKKRAGDMITVVMPRDIGNCTLEDIKTDELCGIFRAGEEALS